MIKVLIVGGMLQGTEAVYLAKKAGYSTIVADKRKQAPAFGLADRFVTIDVLKEEKRMFNLLSQVDVVIPALENKAVLKQILILGKQVKVPVIFDEDAYRISSSKQLSNELFSKLKLPMPKHYPDCGYPVIIKPDGLSGSANVSKAYSKEEVTHILQIMEQDIVIQEYLEGRSFSLEVIGDGTSYYFPQITEVVIDKQYDCKRIIAPAELSMEQKEQFYQIAKTLAEQLKIKGIFDIEVICHKGILKLLEIDARFPSQTPISVYQSTGINMMKMLVESALGYRIKVEKKYHKVCCYQQIAVEETSIAVQGEHIMEFCKSLHVEEDFFGADEAITDYSKKGQPFRAIIITTAHTQKAAYEKFLTCIRCIKEKTGKKEITFTEG